ncbi:MAG: hypothetical protein CMJ83_05550 [Planctomycetes bacterium]|nr:hypothetical protein [Planctomycetota bacterium]
MRNSLVLGLLALILVGGALPAQFIADVREPGGRIRRPRPHRPRFAPITIQSHKVAVGVNDGIARTTVREVFHNPNGMNLEGTFMFPLPDGAAVANFSMRMGGKMVQGEVIEKDKAASIYEGIVRRQKDPALLEYIGKRLFKARVFPIPPRGVAEIELTYDQTLHRDGRTIEFRYPYRTQTVSRARVGQSSVTVTIESSESVLTVYSPSHEVDVVKKGDHNAVVSFETTNDPGDRDFVVVYGLSKNASVGATLFSHDEGNDGAFMLLLAPSSEDKRIIAKDVVFVVDTSGSMAGGKIEQTKKALTYCINSLGESDRFNIVPFATEARGWKDGLVAANGGHKTEAVGYVKGLVARGGTNINDALVQSLGMSKDKDRPFMVIFMTDGEPTIGVTSTQGILSNVKTANKALTRLFVFGVGENLKVDLLDLLAEKNHGARDYVGSKENIEVKVSSFFEKVSSPVLADVSVTIDGVRTHDLYPKKLSDLFKGSQLMLTGRYKGKGTATIRLKGKVDGKEVEHVFERTIKPGGTKTAFVPRLWAVRKCGYLMDQIRLNGKNDELRKEIVRLGKRYGIVTPYTSYLVIEDDVAATPRPGEGRGRGRRGGGVDRDARNDRGGRGFGYGGPGGGGQAGGNPGAGLPGRPRTSTSGVPKPSKNPPASPPAAERSAKEKEVEKLLGGLARQGKKKDGAKAGEARPGRSQRGEEFDEAKSLPRDAYARRLKRSNEARERLRKGFFTDAISLSKEVKKLRERRVANGETGGGLVRRVGNRTFLVRSGLTVETAILDLAADEITKKLTRVEAFSPQYFELIKKPGMAKILALGHSLLFRNGDVIIQIVPEGTLKKAQPAPKTKKADK